MEIYLRGHFLEVRLSPVSFTVVTLHSRSFILSFALSSRVSLACKYLYVDSTWIGDFKLLSCGLVSLLFCSSRDVTQLRFRSLLVS